MSAAHKSSSPLAKKEGNDLLDDILNFGNEHHNISPDFSERIRQIIKKLQEISKRLDNLATRL